VTDDLTDGYEDGAEPVEGPDFTDADAFFAAEVLPVRPAVLHMYGRVYTLPTQVPLSFNLLLERHQEDTGMDAFREVLGPIFGADALDYWISRGIDDRRLGIVLGWAIANMRNPGSVSLAEAARLYDEQTSGKAQTPTPTANRAERRKGRRGGSGRRSSRTGR
jgi:hypothetical protein